MKLLNVLLGFIAMLIVHFALNFILPFLIPYIPLIREFGWLRMYIVPPISIAFSSYAAFYAFSSVTKIKQEVFYQWGLAILIIVDIVMPLLLSLLAILQIKALGGDTSDLTVLSFKGTMEMVFGVLLPIIIAYALFKEWLQKQ